MRMNADRSGLMQHSQIGDGQDRFSVKFMPMLFARLRAICLCLAIFAPIVGITGCKSQPQPSQTQDVANQSQATKTTDSLNEVESTGPQYALKLPASFDRRTGDWDELKSRAYCACSWSTAKQDSSTTRGDREACPRMPQTSWKFT